MDIQQLLREPNPDHALDDEIAEVYLNKRKEYEKTAAEWTAKFAK